MTEPAQPDARHEDGLAVEPLEPIAPHDFRRTLGHFASGITVVTAAVGADRFGLTCQSFFAVSLEPPLVAFAPARTSRSYPRIREAGAFCINVLDEAQQDLARGFARSGADKWADVGWRPGPTGSPVLDDVLAWVDCRWEAEFPAGDHWLVLGRVQAMADRGAGRPLLYFRSDYASLA